jgi:hypothetical protein
MFGRLGRLLTLGEPSQVIRCGVGNKGRSWLAGERSRVYVPRVTGDFCLGRIVVGFLERLLALRAATGPRLIDGGCRGVSASALLQRLLPIGGGALDFKLMDLIPLLVGPLTLRYRQRFL